MQYLYYGFQLKTAIVIINLTRKDESYEKVF